MLSWRTKTAIQRCAEAFGYKIQRIRSSPNSLDVLEVAAHLLLARHQNPFFVQIGANDGVSSDPLRNIVLKYHLRGILVEPNPPVFNKLVDNYREEPQLRFENVAVGPTTGTKTIYVPVSEGSADLFGSFDREVLIRRFGRSVEIREVEVQTVPLGLILERGGNRQLDLVQIDTEGYDFEILKMLDFGRWLPAIVNYEHINLSN